eukprot:scaffold10284_cov118-Isochrysis_galbana.AAC.4
MHARWGMKVVSLRSAGAHQGGARHFCTRVVGFGCVDPRLGRDPAEQEPASDTVRPVRQELVACLLAQWAILVLMLARGHLRNFNANRLHRRAAGARRSDSQRGARRARSAARGRRVARTYRRARMGTAQVVFAHGHQLAHAGAPE